MRTWTRAMIGDVCGGCGAVLDPDAPILAIAAEGWTKIRCAPCAGEPVPADLPARIDPQTPIRVSAHILPFDHKRAAAGERDPEEEG